MPEQTQSNIDQTQLVHQPAPTVANPPPKSTSPKPPQQNGDRDSDSEDDEPKVARDVAIGGMGAIVGGVVVGATMMKLTVNNSGVASDDAAKELEELKQKMKDISSVLQLGDGEVNKDTLEAAISKAIGDAKGTNNAGAVSGGNSDVAAKELQALKGDMVGVSALKFANVGQVNKDSLKKAISEAIKNAKGTHNAGAVSGGNSDAAANELQGAQQTGKIDVDKARLKLTLWEVKDFVQDAKNSLDKINALETELKDTVAQMVKNKKSNAEYSDSLILERDAKIATAKTEHETCKTALDNEHTALEKMRVEKREIRDELDYCKLHLESEKKQKETLKEVLKTLTGA